MWVTFLSYVVLALTTATLLMVAMSWMLYRAVVARGKQILDLQEKYRAVTKKVVNQCNRDGLRQAQEDIDWLTDLRCVLDEDRAVLPIIQFLTSRLVKQDSAEAIVGKLCQLLGQTVESCGIDKSKRKVFDLFLLLFDAAFRSIRDMNVVMSIVQSSIGSIRYTAQRQKNADLWMNDTSIFVIPPASLPEPLLTNGVDFLPGISSREVAEPPGHVLVVVHGRVENGETPADNSIVSRTVSINGSVSYSGNGVPAAHVVEFSRRRLGLPE